MKRIRDFKAPTDAAGAQELRRQLVQFEGNASDMGDEILGVAMLRLSPLTPNTTTTRGPVVAPGQFHFGDTRAGTVSIGLAKPSAKDAGKLTVLIDLGGSAGSFSVRGQGCRYENSTAAVILTSTTYAALIFCDGANYWRIF